MTTIGNTLKETVKFFDHILLINNDENPKPPPPNQSSSDIINLSIPQSSTTPNVSNKPTKDVIEEVFTPSGKFTPTSGLF